MPERMIDQGVFLPCEIVIPVSDDEQKAFHCTQSLRLLPGRRLVCLAESGAKKYVLKLFPVRPRSLEDFEREVAGYELLHHASIEIPGRIYHGPVQDGLRVVVYDYLSRQRPLSEAFNRRPDSKPGQRLLMQFMQLLARLHRDELLHEDPHLDNFLIKADRITVLDAASVRRTGNEQLLDANFGLFVAQFPRTWRVEQACLEHYMTAMGKAGDDACRERLMQQIRSQQVWRERHVLKKIYRQCTQFEVDSTVQRRLIIDRDYLEADLLKRLEHPDALFDGEDTTMLKQGRSSTVGRVMSGNRAYVVKRYNVRPLWKRIRHIGREGRASRSWRNAHRLLLRGIATARPVALVEFRQGPHKGISLFAMEAVAGENSALFFRDQAVTDREHEKIARRMLDLILTLDREQLVHGDLKSTNFIIHDGQVILVDLDAMRVVKSPFRRRWSFMRGIERFRQNWLSDPQPARLFDKLLAEQGIQA